MKREKRVKIMFRYKYYVLIWVVFTQCFCLAGLARSSAVLEAIYVGDYVDYTQIALQYSARKTYCEVKKMTNDPPILIVKLKGIKPGLYSKSHSVDSTALNRMSLTSSNWGLTLMIPVKSNVDLSKMTWNNNNGMLLIDLPFKTPDYSKIPSPKEIAKFKENGGKVVIIDPGHGGHDPGTHNGLYVRRPKLKEKDVALALGKKLKTLMDADPNLMPILIRDGDYYPMPRNVKFSTSRSFRNNALEYRVKLSAEYQGDLFVSIHLNAPRRGRTEKYVRGFEIFYFDENAASNMLEEWRDTEEFEIMNNSDKDEENSFVLSSMKRERIVDQSKLLSTAITQEVAKIPQMELRDPTIKPARWRVISHLNMPSVLIEALFLSHPTEHEFIRKDRNQQRLVQAFYQGIRDFLFPSQGTLVALQTNKEQFMAKSAPKVSAPRYHTVRRGDTLGKIAQRYGISLAALQHANRGSIRWKHRIYIGQKLRIPSGG
ncbi:LysM peptidoglycan-binding domain-containing protein, partial [bacterium]|nr:LysM peptidoglycan-binding domain-containing protein [bacterium]